jgi:SAM-dependent methyltransferase
MPQDNEVRDPGDPPANMPVPARIYDYMLGGRDSQSVDRAAAAELSAVLGDKGVRDVARENRAFHGRVVEYLAGECGITQFLEVGIGLPTPRSRSTHEIAQRLRPGTRVVYVDNDAHVLARSRTILRSAPDTAVVAADIRDPASVLDHPDTNALIDFARPVAVLVIAVLHYVASPGHPRYREGDADPAAIMAAVRDRVAPGSHVAYSGLTQDGPPAHAVTRIEEIYDHTTAPLIVRTREQVTALFGGWHITPPGVVRPWRWRPGPGESPHTDTMWAAVAVKES